MAQNNIFDFSTTAGSNTDISSVSVAEGWAPSLVNNSIRALMAQLKTELANQGTTIAAGSTTSIFATGTSGYVHISGATTITSLGTCTQGTRRVCEFEGVNTLTHNATSLILPGGANITTAAGDMFEAVAEASNNVRVLWYTRADGTPVVAFTGTLTSTAAGAGAGPDYIGDRNKTAANNDLLARLIMRGRNNAAAAKDYAYIVGKILDVAAGTEDGALLIQALINGADTNLATFGPGLQLGAPTGGDKGAGTLNAAAALYVNGSAMPGPLLHLQDQKASGTDGGTFTSGSFQTRVLNTKVTDEVGSTLAANQFTLPAGTYWCEASAPCQNVALNKLKLRNITDASDTLIGQNCNSISESHPAHIHGRFTIAGTKTFELQHRCSSTTATTGLGVACSFSVTEVYAEVRIWKIG